MKILFAEDTEMHRTVFASALEELSSEGIAMDVIEVCGNGQELVEAYQRSGGVDYVFSDIRMPDMDGLTALILIKDMAPNQKMAMVSSESAEKVTLAAQSSGSTAASADDQKKLSLLDSVANRIRSGQEEPGKINRILEACEKLAFDPVEAARHFGAEGYIRKPYRASQIKDLLEHGFGFFIGD